jgi:hypothetical protein
MKGGDDCLAAWNCLRQKSLNQRIKIDTESRSASLSFGNIKAIAVELFDSTFRY